MDETERKRKLQAGKERLAQFQKKKHASPEKKKKKKKATLAEGGEKDDRPQSHLSSLTDHNDWNSSSDVHSASYEDSDQHSTTTEDLSSEELEVVSGEIARIELRLATQRIHQLEETLVGKETALEEFKTQLSQGISKSAEEIKNEDYLRQLQDFQLGITQRDEIISQLRNTLQSTVQSYDVAEGEASDQVHHLVLEVHSLKVHLQQATEELKRQTNDNSNLVTELYETKNHILHLQQQNKEKESILQYLSDSFSKKSEELIEVKNRNQLLNVDLVKSSNEVKRLMRNIEKFQHKLTSKSRSDEPVEANLDDHENEIALIKEELFVQQQLEISKISQQLQKVIDEKMILEVELINFKHKSCDLETIESRFAALEKEKGQLEIENQEWRTKYTDLVKNNGLDRTDTCNIGSDSTLQKISMELSEIKMENKNLRKEMSVEVNRLNQLHLQEIEILHQQMEMANKVGLDHLSNQALELQTLLKEQNPIVKTYKFEERNLLEIQFCLENNIKNLKLILEETKERVQMEEHYQEEVKEIKTTLESQINQKLPKSDVMAEKEMASNALEKGMNTAKLLEELKEQHALEMEQLEDHLQEFHEINWNRKKKEMALCFEEKLNQYSEEVEHTYLQRLESVKAQKDREFVEELQKVRFELSELHNREMEAQRIKLMENIIHHDSEELNSETSKFINQLIQQNQELGNAKKTLLEQLDGIHHKQDELQEEILNLSNEKDKLIAENEQIKHDFKIFSGQSHLSYDLEFRTKYENLKVEYEDLLAKIKLEESLRSSGNSEIKLLKDMTNIWDSREIEYSDSKASISQENLNLDSEDLKIKFFNLSEEFELYKKRSQSRSIDLQNSLDAILKEKSELENKLQEFETSNWKAKFLNLSKEFELYKNQRSNMNDIQYSLDATLKEKDELEKKLHELETYNWKTKFHELSQEYEALRYHLQESHTEKNDFDTFQDLSPQSLADWKKKYELLSSEYCQLKTQLEMELAEPKSGMHSLLSETWSVDTQTVWETTDIETQSEDEEAITWKEKYDLRFKELTETEQHLSNEIFFLKEDMIKLEDENKKLKQLYINSDSSYQPESNVPLQTDLLIVVKQHQKGNSTELDDTNSVNEKLLDMDVHKVDLLHELSELRLKIKEYEKWKSKFEEAAQEKLELQLVIQELDESNLKIKFDNLSQEYNEVKAQLEELNQPRSLLWTNDALSYKRLQEEYCELLVQKNDLETRLSEQEIKLFAIEKEQTEVEILRCERNCLEEKLFNQVNLFENEKLELQQSNTDLQINYDSLLIFKKNLEKELQTQHEKYEKLLAEARLLVLETRGKEKIEAEKIILDFGATEKKINILKDHLRSEKLQKDILNSKVNHLSQENISYIQRHKELHVELLNFHEKLENAWKEQEEILKKLSSARQEISFNKNKYETELHTLQERLLADKVSEEETQNIKVERVALLGTVAKEEVKSKDNIVEQLLEEIKYLKEELQNRKVDSNRENNRLKDALNIERQVVDEIKEFLTTGGFGGHKDVVQNVKNLVKTKSDLEEENRQFVIKISNLEVILKDVQDKISTSNLVSAEVQEMFGHHLTTLQKQRDGLQMEIDSWKQIQKQEINIVSEKITLENALKKELDLKNIALQEKNNLEFVLAHQQGKSEQLLQELRHMTELLQEKNQAEKKLLLCKCSLEQDLKNAEQKLHEQENVLYEKLQLAMELRRHDLTLHKREIEARERQIEFRNCENTLKFQHHEEIKQLKFGLEQENFYHIAQIKIAVEIKHAAAIARLRWEVEQDFASRESKLLEKHAADVSSLQIKHKEQLEYLRVEFETKLIEVSNLPESEKCYQLGSIKLCQKGEQLSGLIKLQQQHEEELKIVRNDLNAVQQKLFDSLKTRIDDMHSKELANIDQEYQLKLQDELSALQNKLTLNFTTEIEVLKAQLEHEKAIDIIEVRENLNKVSKDELNQLEKEWTLKLEQMEKDYQTQLDQRGHAIENSQTLMQKLRDRLNEEHKETIETLTLEWDKRYVECLDQLRKETEAKELLEFKDQQHSIIDKDNSSVVDIKTDVELILKHRERLVEQAEGMRKNLVMHESEMLELRRNVQVKFDQLVEMRTEILKHHDNLQGQLTSVTADYNALNNRHEKEIKELQEKIQQLHELVPEEYENPEKYLQRQLTNLRAKLEEEHKLEMEDLRKYFEKHFEETEKNFSNEVIPLRSNYEGIRTEDVSTSKESDLNESVSLTPEPESQVLSLPPRLEEMESQYEKEAKETLEWYKEQLENFRLTLEIQHESEMENYKLSSDLELEKIRMELMAKYESEIVILNAKHYEELELMQIKFAEDMGKEITKVRLQCASETAKQVEIETNDIQSELERQHKEALKALHLDLKHEHKIDSDSLQSEFNIQKAVEVKRITAELAEKYSTEMKICKQELETVYLVKSAEEIKKVKAELEKQIEEFVGKETILKKELNAEFELKLLNVKDEYENKIRFIEENERELLTNQERMTLETDILKKVLKQSLDKWEELQNDTEKRDDSPEVLKIKKALQHGYENQLKLAKSTLTSEFDESKELTAKEIENEQVKFMEEHQRLMDQFMFDQEKEKASLIIQHSEEVKLLQEQIEELKHSYEIDIENLKKKHIENINTSQEMWENKRLEEINKLHSVNEKEIADLQAHHLEELENLKVQIKEELIVEHMHKFEAITAELENNHQTELEELKRNLSKEFSESLEQMQHDLSKKDEEHQYMMQVLKEDHDREIETLKKEFTEGLASEFEKSLAEMKKVHLDKTQAILLSNDVDIAELDEAHHKEIMELQKKWDSKHQTELQNLHIDFKQRLEDLEKKHSDQDSKLLKERDKVLSESVEKLKQLQQQKEELLSTFEKEKKIEIFNLQSMALQELEDLRQKMSLLSQEKDTLVQQEVEAVQSRYQEQILESSEQHEKLQKEVTNHLEQLDKLEQEKHHLKSELQNLRDRYESMMKQREREHEEGANLVSSLQIDNSQLHQANEHILQILAEMVKNNLAMEDFLNKQLATMASESQFSPNKKSAQLQDRGDIQNIEPISVGHLIFSGSGDTSQFNLTMSLLSGESAELSQRISESLFIGPNLGSETEEIIADTSTRLHTAIQRLLDMFVMITNQLKTRSKTELQLLKSALQNEDVEKLKDNIEELKEQLEQENKNKDYLLIELHKAEGVIKNYEGDKDSLEAIIHQQQESQQALIIELERLNNRVHNFEDNEAVIHEDKQYLVRQRELLAHPLNNTEQELLDASVQTTPLEQQVLLQENSRLNKEKFEIQQQLEKVTQTHMHRNREIETILEEMQMENDKLAEEKMNEVLDARRQIEALEKQVRASKQFLEEQTIEREQEREEFQKELQKLQEKVKEKEKVESVEGRLAREVFFLEQQLKDKMDTVSETLLKKEQLEKELQNKIDREQQLHDTVRDLESQLDEKIKAEHELIKQIDSLKTVLTKQHEDNEELTQQLEELRAFSPSQLEDHIQHLMLQLEMKTKSEESIRQKRNELDNELKKQRTLEEELQQDKEALQQQVYKQLLQISELQAKVDEQKHNIGSGDLSHKLTLFQKQLQEKISALELREKETTVLAEELDKLREKLMEQAEEINVREAQLHIQEDHQSLLLDMKVKELNDDNEKLNAMVKQLKEQLDSTPMPIFFQNLIDEKNQEIDHLNQQLINLQNQIKDSIKSHHAEILAKDLENKEMELSEKTLEIERLRVTMDGMKDQDETPQISSVIMPEQSSRMDKQNEELIELKHLLLIREKEIESLHKEIHMKDMDLTWLKKELERKRGEEILTLNENKLQEDFDTVQRMLEDKQTELIALQQELDNFRPLGDGFTHEQARLEAQIRTLENEVRLGEQILEDKEELILKLNQQLEEITEKHAHTQDEMRKEISSLREIVVQRDTEVSKLLQQLHEVMQNVSFNGTSPGILQQELQEKLNEIEEMKKEMQLKETQLIQMQENLHHQIGGDDILYRSLGSISHEDLEKMRDELDHYKTELILSKAASPSKIYEQQLKELKEELTRDHQRHITEIQKNAERDAVARIEDLERKHRDEIHQLKERFEKEMSENINLMKTELQTVYTDEIERLRDVSRRNDNVELALSDSPSVPEISQRLCSEIETSARLDANLLGVLRRRQEGVGRDSSPQTDNSSSESYSEALSETSVPSALQSLLSRLHKEGVQVLTLSELQFLRQQRAATQTIDADTDFEALQKSWEDEKQYLLQTIQALKDLLSKTTSDSNKRPSELGDGDWRGELLQTIHHVFLKEREALVAELRTFIVSHGNVSVSEIQSIENKIKELMLHQRSALQQIHSADRTSLLSEISDLRTRLSVIRLKQQEEHQKISDQLTTVEEQSSTRERQLKRQMEFLEYKVQQEKVLADDLRSSLEMEKSRTIELSSLLNREKSHAADLEMELSSANLLVSRLQDSLDKEQNHIMSLSVALESEKMQTKSLTDSISQERTNFVLFQERLESEKRRIRMTHERDMQTIQELKQTLDKEKELRMELSKALEKERLASSSIQRELEAAQEQHKESINSLKNRLAGIESALSLEKIRVEELEGQGHAPTRVEYGALQRERNFNQQLRENLEAERGSQLESSLRERTSVADLQALLDLERSKTLELQTAVERERYKITSLNKTLDDERNRATEELETEKAAYRQLKKTLESLQSQKQELQKQLQAEKDRAARLCNERDRFSSQLAALHEREQEKEKFREEERQVERERQRKREVEREQERQKQREFHLEIQQHRQKFQDMQRIIDQLKQREKQLSRELELERSLHQKSMNILKNKEMTKESQINQKNKEHISQYKCQLEFLRQQLQKLLIHFQEECAKNFPMSHDGVSQSPINEIQRLQNCASEIFIELRQLQTALTLDTESVSLLFEMPSAVKFNDRVLKQNAELIGSLSQLSQEKLELRLALAKLEDEVWRYRQRDTQIIQSARKTLETSGSVLSAERTAWLQERNTLQNALSKADSRIIYLNTELHKTNLELDRLKEQAILGSLSSDSRMDDAKIQRLYGKYLRSESFRKALVYQKKYLIILLGGFQDTEEATLSMIAKMGVYPSEQDVQRRLRHPVAFTRFRSVVRVIIAIGRMKFLVKKWRRAVRVGSPISCGRVNVLREESLGNGIQRSNSPYSPPHTRYGAILAKSMGPFKGNHSVTTAHHYSRDATGITPPVKETTKSTIPVLSEKLSSVSARRSLISTSTNQAAPSTQLYKSAPSSEAISHSNSSSSGFVHHLESLSHQLDQAKIINGASKTIESSDSSSSWR